MAQYLGVDVYSVGVEMVTASQQSDYFIKLVNNVKQIFGGTVTYSANWGAKGGNTPPPPPFAATQDYQFTPYFGGEIDVITWINVLDVIGLDAYYPLTDSQNPTFEELLQSWSVIVPHVRNISQFWGKSVIFTEIGYRSIEGTAIMPGAWNNKAAVNITQQAICYNAVFQACMNETWWQGIYWWAWSTDPNAGGDNDTGFWPQNKAPSISVLQHYYFTILICSQLAPLKYRFCH